MFKAAREELTRGDRSNGKGKGEGEGEGEDSGERPKATAAKSQEKGYKEAKDADKRAAQREKKAEAKQAAKTKKEKEAKPSKASKMAGKDKGDKKTARAQVGMDGSLTAPAARSTQPSKADPAPYLTSLTFTAAKVRELQAIFPGLPRSPAPAMGSGPGARFLWDLFSAAQTHTNQRNFPQGIDIFERLAASHTLSALPGFGQLGGMGVGNGQVPLFNHDDGEGNDAKSTLAVGLPELYRGMATAMALSGQLLHALAVMDRMLTMVPDDFDGLTRRAEVLTALSQTAKAKLDLDDAIVLAPSAEMKRELLVNRGMLLFRQQEFRAAYRDFLEAKELPRAPYSQNDPSRLYNYLGKCEQEFGDWRHSLESQDKAIELDANNKEAHYDRAISLISASIWEPAVKEFAKVIDIDPHYKNAYGYRGLLYQNLGRPEDAIDSFHQALAIDPADPMVLLLKAVCEHACGRYADSVATYTRLMAVQPGHACVNRREVALYVWVRALTPLDSFNMDAELNPYTKMGINKGTVFNPLLHNLDEEDDEDNFSSERINPFGLTLQTRQRQVKVGQKLCWRQKLILLYITLPTYSSHVYIHPSPPNPNINPNLTLLTNSSHIYTYPSPPNPNLN